jgi:hypothetical protein
MLLPMGELHFHKLDDPSACGSTQGLVVPAVSHCWISFVSCSQLAEFTSLVKFRSRGKNKEKKHVKHSRSAHRIDIVILVALLSNVFDACDQ